jgi:hypothetical protein
VKRETRCDAMARLSSIGHVRGLEKRFGELLRIYLASRA